MGHGWRSIDTCIWDVMMLYCFTTLMHLLHIWDMSICHLWGFLYHRLYGYMKILCHFSILRFPQVLHHFSDKWSRLCLDYHMIYHDMCYYSDASAFDVLSVMQLCAISFYFSTICNAILYDVMMPCDICYIQSSCFSQMCCSSSCSDMLYILLMIVSSVGWWWVCTWCTSRRHRLSNSWCLLVFLINTTPTWVFP